MSNSWDHKEGQSYLNPDCECAFCEEMWNRRMGAVYYGKRLDPDPTREAVEDEMFTAEHVS